MKREQHFLKRAQDFQLTLTRSMLETLELNRTLYVILSGVTAGDGLDFNRAFLLLDDGGARLLRGEMAIGPSSAEEAHRIWTEMELQRFNLHVLMERYDLADHNNHELTRKLRNFTMPLPLKSDQSDPLDAKIVQVMMQGRSELLNDTPMKLSGTDIELLNFAMVPLLIGEHAIGLIIVDNAYNKRLIQPQELDDLKSLANLAAIAVERARMHERLERMATIDGLTGLMNRRYFDEAYQKCFLKARYHHEPLSLAIIDLDHFKAVNDHYGHLAGDDFLRETANIILSRVRHDDIAARFGGDELVLVLPLAKLKDAEKLAKDLQEKIRNSALSRNLNMPLTVSIGIAALSEKCRNHLDLIEQADQALYQAKIQGRDRVVAYEEKAK